MWVKIRKSFFISLLFTLLLNLAYGEDVKIEDVTVAVDNIWVLLSAFLVFFMQAGFAMVEAGFTRSKNASNIVMKNLMDFAIGSVVFWLIGFGFMFGKDWNGLIGISGFGLLGSFEHLGLTIPLMSFLIFQTVFAGTAATIVSGAMAERTKFIAYCIYSAIISLIIYPVVGHWAWGGGWLSKLGFIDFAGSTVVHSVGGWCALIGAYLLGPRIGKYTKEGKVTAIPGHSITLAALGVFILWFGWFGFNPGSTLSGMNKAIGKIAVNTNIAAAMGANLAMIFTWIKYKKPDVSMTLNGALAGLVAITAGCASVNIWGSALIGGLAGLLVVLSVEYLDQKVKIDDPVGAISVHGVCGAFGTIMVGFLAEETGLLYGGGLKQLIVQVSGVLSVFLWTSVTAYILFSIIKKTVGLRVSEKEEVEGLDIAEHGSVAYGDFVVKSSLVK
ncbi:MAG: ammonium transporter [Dictyoglomus sp.]|nr:ammonium transporter [Dictyoglomus sp.]MCX7942475.1 ammonium transporter [Dictyoglomaceae bacterium]MDW8188299.1 ammonium transporter [Dictyoglomus sp.]